MALDLSVKGLAEEIRLAELNTRSLMAGFDDDVRRLSGPHHRAEDAVGDGDPENHNYEWLTLWLGYLTSGNPRVDVATSRIDPHSIRRAKALEYALNHWVESSRMRLLNEQLLTDYALRYGACCVRADPDPDDAEGRMRVIAERIYPGMFVWDPVALVSGRRRFSGHLDYEDLDDLIERATSRPEDGWSAEVLRELKPTRRDARVTARHSDQVNRRNELGYWTIHVAEHELPFGPAERERFGAGSWREAGYNGTLFFLAQNQANEGWIREPQPCFCHRDGPYVSAGAVFLPNDSAPVSPLTVVKGQVAHLNGVSLALIESIESYKRMVVTSSRALAELVTSGEDLSAYV